MLVLLMDIKMQGKRKTVGVSSGRRTSSSVASQRPATAATHRARTARAQPAQSFPLPRYYAPQRPKRVLKRKSSVRKTLVRGVALLFVCILGASGFLSWRAYTNLHKVFHGNTTVAALSEKPVTPNLLKGEGDGRVNILLLGIGGSDHAGGDLTDSIVVLSIDPVNNTAAMLGVPRDMWVKMPVNYFGAYQKINAAYSSAKYKFLGKVDLTNKNADAMQAGLEAGDQAITEVLGIPIHYNVLVNFQAFKQAVDTVGGVTIDVKEQLYDPTMAWENKWNPVLAPAGVQQMDGTKALMYARSRETSSDFARNERQRQILLALKDKVLTAGTLSNPAKIDGLMNTLGNNVYTDISTQAATRLYEISKKIDDSKIASLGMTQPPTVLVTTDRVGTASVVRPKAGFNNYTDIQAFVRTSLPDGYLVKEKAAVAVLAPTQKQADEQTAVLKSYGYNVTSTGVAPVVGDNNQIFDLSSGKNPYTKNYLQKRYGVIAGTNLPSGVTSPAGNPKFVIIVSK